MTWTPEVEARARKLYADGFSRGMIAKKLKLSRSAVIGWFWRHGLHDPPMRKFPPGPKVNHAKIIARPKPRAPVYIEMSGVGLVELSFSSCRWPLNEGVPDWLFCGAPGRPYCGYHTQKATRRVLKAGTRSDQAENAPNP